jgi:hypothetical protein
VVVGTSTLTVALIGAIAAIAGTIVGGVITGIVALLGEKKRQEFARDQEEIRQKREDHRETVVVLGAARIWRTRLMNIATQLSVCIESNGWWLEDYEPPALPPTEDRKRVVAALDPPEWIRVELAEAVFEVVVSRRRHRDRSKGEAMEPPFHPDDSELVAQVLVTVNIGLEALAGVAAEGKAGKASRKALTDVPVVASKREVGDGIAATPGTPSSGGGGAQPPGG